MIKVKNMSYNNRKVANQFIIEDGDMIYFQSYDSMILGIDKQNGYIYVGEDFSYSRTTTKYTKIYLEEVFTDDFGLKVFEAIKKEEPYIPTKNYDFHWCIFYNEYPSMIDD